MSIAHSVNSPTPKGVAGSSGVATTALALATVTCVKRRISDVEPICPFAFYGNNTLVAVASSELQSRILDNSRSVDLLRSTYIMKSLASRLARFQEMNNSD